MGLVHMIITLFLVHVRKVDS